MAENDKTEEFLQKLAPCIQRGKLDACVGEAARLADEIGMEADDLLELSSQVGKEGKYELAYVVALGAVGGLDDSGKGAAYSNAGLAAQSLRDADLADKQYKKSIEADPNNEATHYNYAVFLHEHGKKNEAEKQYKKVIEANPNNANAHYNYAILLHELGKKKEAEEQYPKAIVANPNNAAAYYSYAVLLRELGKNEKVEEYCKKAIEVDPNNSVAHSNYAILLHERGKNEDAEKHYKKAIEADLNNAAAHYKYAILLHELGKKEKAEEHYKKSIGIDPNNAGAHYNYANLLRERRKFYDAEKEVSIALQIAQAEPSEQYVLSYGHATLGDILADEDDYKDAVKEYKKSLNLLEGSHSDDVSFISEIHNNLGWAYIQLKKSEKARDEFKSAYALDPMNIKARRNLRALGKVGSESGVCKTPIFLLIMLLLPFITSYYLFIIEKLSEALFVTQSLFLIALIIFVALYPEVSKVKVGAIEFEMSTELRSMEAKSMAMERMSRDRALIYIPSFDS